MCVGVTPPRVCVFSHEQTGRGLYTANYEAVRTWKIILISSKSQTWCVASWSGQLTCVYLTMVSEVFYLHSSVLGPLLSRSFRLHRGSSRDPKSGQDLGWGRWHSELRYSWMCVFLTPIHPFGHPRFAYSLVDAIVVQADGRHCFRSEDTGGEVIACYPRVNL